MLVVFLLFIALAPGCVRSSAPDPLQTRDNVAADREPEIPLLPAAPFIPAETVLNEPTELSDAMTENAGSSPPTRQTESPSLSPSLPIVKYTVGSGENLWSIAARPDIYADALLWPLLYQANRDQIRDPRQIYPGQTLSVPRNTSEAQKEEARETARRSTIFPFNRNPLPSN